jgi:hypothetical protein
MDSGHCNWELIRAYLAKEILADEKQVGSLSLRSNDQYISVSEFLISYISHTGFTRQLCVETVFIRYSTNKYKVAFTLKLTEQQGYLVVGNKWQ